MRLGTLHKKATINTTMVATTHANAYNRCILVRLPINVSVEMAKKSITATVPF